MQLDTRRPVLVLIGAWNAAIFQQPKWVAKHLHGLKEGAQTTYRMYHNTDENRTITFIGDYGIGYSANESRLEFYITSFNRSAFDRLVSFIGHVMETLPHTPMGDFGVNFTAIESDPSPDVLDRIQSSDNLSSTLAICRRNPLQNKGLTLRARFR